MGLPKQPVTLSAEQVEELARKLSTMRHDINNQLSLVVAAVELIQLKPEIAPRMYNTIAQQPARITDELGKFSAEFDKLMGITQ